MYKVDLENLREIATEEAANKTGITHRLCTADRIPAMQIAVYTMCGGGFLGKMAAEQPADFYIDTRCGRLPYGRRAIEQAVKVLAIIAEAHGLDPRHLPEMPRFHNMGAF